jgi:hypothetical protein
VFIVYVVGTLLAAAANLYAAGNDFRRVAWIVANMERLGISRSRLWMLGALKTAGAIGLLVGFALPSVGIAAAAGLIVFFLGAIVFTLRARWYSHLPFPVLWLVLAIAALALRAAVT